MDRVTRPRRYMHDPRLSRLVDQLTELEDEYFANGDAPNERRAHMARQLILTIALGEKR